ncbi:MAG TPA: glycine cleavage system protein H, partial [Streptosporangiaceae bacterium]|nr:glycine cleavage system protein H [Streptosporangiaceae bacterium]
GLRRGRREEDLMTNDTSALLQVDGFPLALDRLYQPETHMWIALSGPASAPTVRIGMDALGVETSGTLAQVALPESGARLAAGQPFGEVEAVKFVGPLISPVSGAVRAVNADAAADPGLVERDPLGAGWLIEAELSDPADLGSLLGEPEEITAWYAAKITEYRLSGAIAR